MERTTINIKVVGDSRYVACVTDMEGEIGGMMIGLTNALQELETKFLEECRADFRTLVLKMLNDRH